MVALGGLVMRNCDINVLSGLVDFLTQVLILSVQILYDTPLLNSNTIFNGLSACLYTSYTQFIAKMILVGF